MKDFHELGSLVMTMVTRPKRSQRHFTGYLKRKKKGKIALGIISPPVYCGYLVHYKKY